MEKLGILLKEDEWRYFRNGKVKLAISNGGLWSVKEEETLEEHSESMAGGNRTKKLLRLMPTDPDGGGACHVKKKKRGTRGGGKNFQQRDPMQTGKDIK